jgi:serine protease inhibitor
VPFKTFIDQRGVALILEVVLITALLSLAGFVGFRTYQARNSNINDQLPSQAPKNLPQAHNAFGFNLLKVIAADEAGKNVFISPPSIALALSMVYNGADGSTKEAMTKTLQFQNLDLATINQESLGLIKLLRNPDDKIELAIANSAWVRQGFDIKPAFATAIEDYYQAEATVLDFNQPKAAKDINSWASKNTKGKIPSIVKSLPQDMVLLLVNAVYFKGEWTTQFDKQQSQDRDFTLPDKSAQKRPFMRQKADFQYLETDDFQSVALPYGKNKALSMYVFLPKDLSEFTKKLDAPTWNQWMSEYKEAEGTVLLPRFKLEYEKDLPNALRQLGMSVALSDQANFSGIGDNLYISSVKHKTYVDVNEEGTEAAAVTSVGVSITSVQPAKKSFTMDVNRPFFIAIRDNKSQTILFTGLIQRP